MPPLRNLPHLPPKRKALALTRIGPPTPTPPQSSTGSAAIANISIIRSTAQSCARTARTGNVPFAPNTPRAYAFLLWN